MRSTERSAKTTTEAVELALAELGAGRDQVRVEVLSEGRSGILGIGSEVARVRVTLKDEHASPITAGKATGPTVLKGRSGVADDRASANTDANATASATAGEQQDLAVSGREILEKILRSLGIQASVEVKPPSTYGMMEGQVSCILDIQGPDLGILIGRRGKTLFSLQYLVNLILSKRYRSRVKVFVDVEAYRLRRQDSLRSLALRMADQVRVTGREVALEAMPPHERRIVHLALQSNPHVVTESMGEGEDRKVIISPKK